MSVICQTFVQNTWRSDLCSNCFKSLEDHMDGNRRHSVCEKIALPRYVPQAPSLYQSRGISTSLKWRLNESLYDRVGRRDFASQTLLNNRINEQHRQAEQDNLNRGILVKTDSAEKKYKSRGSVDFADEEAMVIGYGGNDYDSDTSPWEMGSDDGSVDLDLLNDTDEDRKISRLTKNNTEFNSSNKNLMLAAEDNAKLDSSNKNLANNNKQLGSANRNQRLAVEDNKNLMLADDKQLSSANRNQRLAVEDNKTRAPEDAKTTGNQDAQKLGKKLSQYFFPSPTEALKSYLNRHGSDMIIDREAVIRSNSELCQAIHSIQRTSQRPEDRQAPRSLADLEDTFSPLNTKTYSFVSELNKGSEHGSDSDYSTCRMTGPGDSSDSESGHVDDEPAVVERARASSFLHGSFAVADKKFDAGSSTSGDVSNLSDDSDADRADYNKRDGGGRTDRERDVGIRTNCKRDDDARTDYNKRDGGGRTDHERDVGIRTNCKRDDGVRTNCKRDDDVRSDYRRGNVMRTISERDNADMADYKPDDDTAMDCKRDETDHKRDNDIRTNSKRDNDDRTVYRPDEGSRTDCMPGDKENTEINRGNIVAKSTPSPPLSNKHTVIEQKPSPKESNRKNEKNVAVSIQSTAKQSPPSTKHAPPPSMNTTQKSRVDADRLETHPGGSAISANAPDLVSSARPNERSKANAVSDTNSAMQKTLALSESKPTPQKLRDSNRNLQEPDSSPAKNGLVRLVSREDLPDDYGHGETFNRDSGYQSASAAHDDDYEDISDSAIETADARQSKLAALALELELARKDNEKKIQAAKKSLQRTVSHPPQSIPPTGSTPSDASNYPTIKKPSSAVSCVGRLSSLPDVLPDATSSAATPAAATKQKKSRFSLKKLLKRNKDSCSFSPADGGKAANPKAWKKQSFDRGRLSLEIVHPMDLAEQERTSVDSSPSEEGGRRAQHAGRALFKGVSSRARSLSALPQLTADEPGGVALIECRRVDSNTMPARKAGTVAERKKTRPSLVRTPSCSALPNRTAPSQLQGTSPRAPPPKPPPPPKCKAVHPPPPPPPQTPHPKSVKTTTSCPVRPPPPKVPDTKPRSHSISSSPQELHETNNSDKEYANLGDIRSLLTPKKPQRPSAFSGTCRDGETADRRDGHYETLPPTQEEEEDHYTYLDEAEVKSRKAEEAKKQQSPQAPKNNVCGRPWLDLQTSYAAIAAANYESLAELISTTQDEKTLHFKKVESSLKWKDFMLETDQQLQMIGDRVIYDAVWKEEPQSKVTLLVAPKKYVTAQNVRNQTRHPVLASFVDTVPKNAISPDNSVLQDSETAAVYVLQLSSAMTVKDFAKTSSIDEANQSIHLRNYCFVLLQLIHTLKSLQAEGIEDINYDLEILVLVVTDEDKPPILVLFPEDKVKLTSSDFSVSRKTLCQATLETMLHFLQIHEVDDLKECLVNGEQLADPVAHTFSVIAKVLAEEKASSLSQAKGFLEYMLWGPVDIGGTDEDTILQRWLDLQRAQMVKSTISQLQSRKTSSVFHVYEEYQLVFLLQASVKSLKNVISKL